MAEGDWIRLHRKSLDSRVFSDASLWRLWCWCLLRSSWKRSWYAGCELLPGQFVCGREAASAALGISGSAWYRGMQKLQELGCIKLEANSRFTKVSVIKWDEYQQTRTADEQPVNSERTAGEQRADSERTAGSHNSLGNNDLQAPKKVKKVKKAKKDKKHTHTPPDVSSFVDVWNAKVAELKELGFSYSTVAKLTDKRKAKLATRLRDPAWPELFQKAVSALPIKQWSSWTPDFDWMIANDENVPKVVEGQYHKKDFTRDDKNKRVVEDYEPGSLATEALNAQAEERLENSDPDVVRRIS